MDERARSCLLSSTSKLEQDIKASYIMDHMVSDGVLNTDEEEKVKACTTRKEKAVALLNLILKKDNYAYISFYNALLHEGYGDLASMLQKDLPLISPAAEKSFLDGGTPFVQTILCEGGVPQRPVVFVCRPELINCIREKLYKLENSFGWVAVFGMAGFGKSVLTAEAVRDEQLIKACFPGGVHWLSVGQLDKAGLLVKMQSLCYRLDQDSQSSQRSPVSIEEARDRLRFLMVRKYPRSLLILDDIWDSGVLKAFDIQCRVLFSTRDRGVTDSVSGKKYEVSVDHGLEDDKALEVLALFVNKKVSELPVQARSIVQECKGSPLVVSLIGALLREFPDRWQYYLKQLQNKQFKRIRKSSSYDYDALDQAMSVSIDVLHEDRKEYYKDLSVLEKDVKVPAKVLSILWDLEPEEAEDILQEFVNKSLLFRDCNKRPYQYYLHDLQLDFLTEQNRYRLKDLHSKMVRLYQNHYKKGHPTVADEECMYWFRYLAYHMAHGNLREELYSLMFSLDWVKAKAQMMGPASLINDYVVYKDILDEENSTVRDNFQEFLSLNGHHLSQKPFPDVVQMGLCQPDSSEVYRQARLKAEQETKKGAFYLEWINKSSLESLSRLIVRPHKGAVYYACFSHNWQQIASCGSDKTLQVFKSQTGEKLLEVQAHDDDVLCCAFSPDDKLIATCSADKKIKVWNSQNGNLLRTYDEHSEQVNHCQFTNTSRKILLATCSNDNFIKLWNTNRPGSQNTMFGHGGPVNHCCFSPDDQYLASCSSDGTLKLWEVHTANEWKSIDILDFFPSLTDEPKELEEVVRCSAWSSDGTRIMAAAKNMVFLWDLESNKKVADCSGHLSWVHCVRFSPDGSVLLSSSDDQTVRLWETKKVHPSSAVSLKRDSDVLFHHNEISVVAPDSRKRKVLEIPSGNTLCTLTGHTKTVLHCQFTPDGQTLITCSEDTTVRVWDWKSLECKVLKGHSERVKRFRLLDSSRLLSWSFDGTVKIWSFDSTSALHILNGHKDCVRSCRFSWDNQCLATGDDNGEIRIWCVLNGSLLHICARENKDSMESLHGGWVTDLHFSPDSKMLVSTGGYIKWWDVEKGESLQTFYTTGTNLKGIHVSPDFKTFVTIDNIGVLYILCKVG
ncbi:Apoptotic protease-activating factor 1 [Acipenser ruthenus]|uniref:Apoptotic protease-activating factor 1 n=1 Tax=Acipenser ruthenus TaxID=7906 RepID=A0A444UND8_ACIRT|nr:Apoptotic protease-activating factor 1 [Acipenser ruthenus]